MSNDSQHDDAGESVLEPMTVRKFLETVPPDTDYSIPVVSGIHSGSGHKYVAVPFPVISLWCEACDGFRNADTETNRSLFRLSKSENIFVEYRCNNCGVWLKTYAIRLGLITWDSLAIYKIGEMPQFGPPTPKALLKLAGSEREYFFKGRRAENQSLGIAAFAYYRRVVEVKKNFILDQVARVASLLDDDNPILEQIEKAKRETQFTNAVEVVKHGIPKSLYINGHNPLTLLHSALSDGLHNRSDEECLTDATAIRLVLSELVDRIEIALKDDKVLTSAVQALVKRNADKK